MQTPSFRWTVGYQGETEYEVRDHTGTYVVRVRYAAPEWLRQYHQSLSDEEYQREVLDAVGLVRRVWHSDQPIPAETVAALNAWLQAEHASLVAQVEGHYAKYGGQMADDDPLREPCMTVRGATYKSGVGWVVDEPEPAKQTA